MVRLGDLFEFKNGRSFSKTEWREVGLPIIRIQNLNDISSGFNYFDGDYDKSIEVNKNDLLFSWSGTVGSSFGPHIWVRDKGVLNQHIYKVSFKTDMISKYAYYALLFLTEEIERSVVGAVGLVHVTKKSLNEFKIYVPAVPEQKRIVTILDQAFADIEQARAKTEQNLKNVRELFESYLQQVFSELNEGWEIKPLESFANIVNGYAFKSGDFTASNKVKSIKITNVGVYEFVEEEANLLPASYSTEFSRFKACTGDIVIALTRTIISSGLKVAVVPQSYDGALINQRVAAIQVDEAVMPKEMLQAFLSTKVAIDYVKSHVNELMQPNLSINDLTAFPIPVPPRDKRLLVSKQISEIKAQTDKLSSLYIEKLRYLDELKKSILQKAFTGQLTNKKSQKVAA